MVIFANLLVQFSALWLENYQIVVACDTEFSISYSATSVLAGDGRVVELVWEVKDGVKRFGVFHSLYYFMVIFIYVVFTNYIQE
jgi:hypothetical protein